METNFSQLLKEHQLSLTAVRLAVLEVLRENQHSDANKIFDLVKQKIPTATIQAIYNNLNTLTERGIIREIKPKGHVSLYETRVGDNHHHIVCRCCDAVMDTHCHEVAPCLSPDESHGFTLDEAEIIFWGICPACKNAALENIKGEKHEKCR